MELTTVYDCTGANLGKFPIPPGVSLAGYVTGTGGVPWTPAQLAQHPGAIRIDQWPVNTPAGETADVLDVEPGAATVNTLETWVHAAWASYRAGVRPGQRTPTIYMNRSTMTPVANALVAAGITSGVNLWLAEPMDRVTATGLVTQAGGPYPVVGVQYEFHGDYDVSVFNAAWLNNVSGKAPALPLDTRYTVQVERYQDGFGWVLDVHFATPPASRYRARVSDGEWSPWQEFRP